ncbi:MAG: phosphatase PAP2 family protein [Bacteroidota bacterium]|jgi:membrane-associated phospholipid phosphatase
MRHRYFISLLLIVLCGFSPYGVADLFAQNPTSQDTVQGNKYNFSQFEDETWSFIKQPTKWDGGDWLRLGVMSGATFLTMQVDQPIRDAVLRDNRRYFYSVPIVGARMYGELYSPFVFFGGFALHYWITDNITSRKIAYEVGQACLYTGALELFMKSLIGRARPYMNEGRATYHTFTFVGDEYHSLPGGHTATAFVISTVLSRNVDPTWLKVLVYLPAIITPISRVYQDQHWTSDNVLGGAIGYFIATWVVDIHERNDSRVHVSSIFPLTISITLN